MGVYPFMFAKYDDFLPIVDQLTNVRNGKLSRTWLCSISLTSRHRKGKKSRTIGTNTHRSSVGEDVMSIGGLIANLVYSSEG